MNIIEADKNIKSIPTNIIPKYFDFIYEYLCCRKGINSTKKPHQPLIDKYTFEQNIQDEDDAKFIGKFNDWKYLADLSFISAQYFNIQPLFELCTARISWLIIQQHSQDMKKKMLDEIMIGDDEKTGVRHKAPIDKIMDVDLCKIIDEMRTDSTTSVTSTSINTSASINTFIKENIVENAIEKDKR